MIDGEDARLARLERLGALHQKGVLTDEEFAAEKARILAGWRVAERVRTGDPHVERYEARPTARDRRPSSGEGTLDPARDDDLARAPSDRGRRLIGAFADACTIFASQGRRRRVRPPGPELRGEPEVDGAGPRRRFCRAEPAPRRPR